MDSIALHITICFALKARDERWSWKLCRTMFDHDVRSCYQLLLYSLCVALGKQSKMAWNSVVEEVVWSVLPCISQSAFALKVRDGRMAPSFFLLRMAPGAAVEDSMKIKFVKVV